MGQTLHIIVTCTKQKTVEIPDALRLRNVPARTLAERAQKWIGRLESTQAPRVPAESLYCGDHWQLAKQLRAAATSKGFEPKLWVISTGYGLIPADVVIKPYMATFSESHDDRICVNGGSNRVSFPVWWEQLAQWVGPHRGSPRTLAQLVKRDRSAALLIVASAAYLAAVRHDLESAAKRLMSPEQLLIVSGGTKDLGALTPALVPLNARAQAVLGGARRTLNVRMARWILKNAATDGRLEASAVQMRCKRWLERQPKLQIIRRSKSTDEDVQKFVSTELRRNPRASFTRLLKKLRAGSGQLTSGSSSVISPRGSARVLLIRKN